MSKPVKIAYSVSVRGDKKFWNRIGVAFENKDGSINIKLDCLPIDGEIQIRDYVDKNTFPKEDELG